MPLPTAATSWLACTLTRLVRSPSRLSMSSIISVISFCVFNRGIITSWNTQIRVVSSAATLMMMDAVLAAIAVR